MKFHGFLGNLLCKFKEWGCTYKNTYTLTPTHPRILNMVPNQSLFYLVVRYAKYLISVFMNINENLRNVRKKS